MALSLNPPTVRAALDPSLLPADLTDAVIELAIYSGAAKSEIIRRFPDADDATADDKDNLESAWALLTSARLAPVLARLERVNFGSQAGGYERNKIETDALIAELRSRAEEHLALVVDIEEVEDAEATALLPPTFGRAEGTRGL